MPRRPTVSILTALGLLTALAVAAADPPKMGTLDFLDHKNGFRDARFGTPPAALEGLGPLKPVGDLRCGRRPEEKLKLGSAQLSGVQYCYFDDKLARIVVSFSTVVDTELGQEGLREAWGQPLSIVRAPGPSVARRLSWTGDSVRAVLETREHVSEGGTLTLTSAAYSAHLKAVEAERDKARQERFGKDL